MEKKEIKGFVNVHMMGQELHASLCCSSLLVVNIGQSKYTLESFAESMFLLFSAEPKGDATRTPQHILYGRNFLYRADHYGFIVFYLVDGQAALEICKEIGMTIQRTKAKNTGSFVNLVSMEMGEFLEKLGLSERIKTTPGRSRD